jgi:hypothetical protein
MSFRIYHYFPTTYKILAVFEARGICVQAPVKAKDYTVFMTDGTGEMTIKGAEAKPETACQFLEKGGIIYFPETPFFLSPADRRFHLAPA